MKENKNLKIQFFKEKFQGLKKFITGCADFLEEGKWGGMVLSVLLATQFTYGCFLQEANCILPKPLVFLCSFLLVAIISEILYFLVKIIMTVKNRSRIYFLTSFIILSVSAAGATQFAYWVPGFILGFIVALSVDLFGKCVFSICIKKNYRKKFGYITGLLSFCIIILFGLFFHLDRFGEKGIDRYLAMEEKKSTESSNTVEGFSEYIEDGIYSVGVLDYGVDSKADISTDTTNLSNFVEREGVEGILTEAYFDYSLEETPIAGRIWYPENASDCPILFIAHGNHIIDVPSYLGYEYLGKYLASNGYVVVSVDENAVNCLSNENDARAILFLENMKTILNENSKSDSPLYGKMNPEKIAIAGHSRGGEMVALTYLLNDLDRYPDNGNIKLDYHFLISSIIAIAPTVDQYMPADHNVSISDVNYLLIQGSNDHDVTTMMGEKQYHNITFTENSAYYKASVYILGANHGQFNSRWGRYDLNEGLSGFLNTANFISDTDQQKIAKAYIRTFLDDTLFGKKDYADLFVDENLYRGDLPDTLYLTNYQSGNYEPICSFDEDADIVNSNMEGAMIQCSDVSKWSEERNVYGFGTEGENYVLSLSWSEKAKEPKVELNVPSMDLSQKKITFRIGDMREKKDLTPVSYTVTLYDEKNHKVQVSDPVLVYPSLALQLYKQDIFLNQYEYKHQMQGVIIDTKLLQGASDFDMCHVNKMVITFQGLQDGDIILDDIGIMK